MQKTGKQGDYRAYIEDLHCRQIDRRDSEFLRMHLTNRTIIVRHVDICLTYMPYVKSGNILDWGCKHAFDSCLVKYHFDKEVTLFGCDIVEEPYELFFEAAGLRFSALSHPYKLPYEDSTFDTVISSGTLEHVPNDCESLKEIYRILKPGGRFIITFLPNRYSYIEALCRFLKRTGHSRLYSMRQILDMLLHAGFMPIYYRHHQVLPSLAGAESLYLGQNKVINGFIQYIYRYNRVFEKIWPLNKMASNIAVVSEKKLFI